MIADTSVWIDASRGRHTWQVARLRDGIRERSAMVVDPVRLEVLAGLGPEVSASRVIALLGVCEEVMQLHRVDAEEAAEIYRICRSFGRTIRSLTDCLIAAIAIRNDAAVLHRDRDYEVIAKYVPLRVVVK